jgi:D-methionine transport system ATP-binding protein
VIEFIDVHKSFEVDGRSAPALSGIDLRIEAGEVFGIIGHSGAGKSTLVRHVNLLERPSSGRVLIDGEDVTACTLARLREVRRSIGMIFQHFNLLSSQTVAGNVAFPLRLAGALTAREIRQRVAELLERVGLQAHAGKYPRQLSGGQKQRVGIARALATRPKILLCDEATSALDPQTTQSVLQLLAEINQEFKLTIVVITHEMDVVRRICDRVAVLDAGRIVESGRVAEVFLHPRHPGTQRLVQETGHMNETLLLPAHARAGCTVRLTTRGASTFEPLLCHVTRETGADFSILSGRIDRIKDEPYGQLILSMTGAGAAAALQRLADAGVSVEVVEGACT